MRCSKEQCCRDATHVAVLFIDDVLSEESCNVENTFFYCSLHSKYTGALTVRTYTFMYLNKVYNGQIIPVQEWEILRIKSKL